MAYIEINFNIRNGKWEAFSQGGLISYADELHSVLDELTDYCASIEDECEDYQDYKQKSENLD
jgi:hypothetical protein